MDVAVGAMGVDRHQRHGEFLTKADKCPCDN